MEGIKEQNTQLNQQIFEQKNMQKDLNQQSQFIQQGVDQQINAEGMKTEVKTAQSTMKSLLSSKEVYGENLEKKEATKETEAETKQRQRTEKVRKFAIKCAQKFLADWAKRVESDPNAEVPKLNIKIKGVEGLANATVLAAMAIRGHIMETYADKKEVLSKLLNAVNFNLIASDPMQEEGSSAADNIDFAPEVIKTAKVEAIDKSVKYSHDKEEKIPMGTIGANITSTVFYSLTKNAPKFKSAKFVNTSKVIITKNKLSAEKMSEIESKCIDNGIYYVDDEGEVQICNEQKLEELNKKIDAFKDDETKKNTIKEVVGAWKNTAKQEKKEDKPNDKESAEGIPDTLEIDTTKALSKGEKKDKDKDKKEEDGKPVIEVNDTKKEQKKDKKKDKEDKDKEIKEEKTENKEKEKKEEKKEKEKEDKKEEKKEKKEEDKEDLNSSFELDLDQINKKDKEKEDKEKEARQTLKKDMASFVRKDDKTRQHDYIKIQALYDELLNLLEAEKTEKTEKTDENDIAIYLKTTEILAITKDFEKNHYSRINRNHGKDRIKVVDRVAKLAAEIQEKKSTSKQGAEAVLRKREEEKQALEKKAKEKLKKEALERAKQKRIEERSFDKKITEPIENMQTSSKELFTEDERKKLKKNSKLLKTLQDIDQVNRVLSRIKTEAASEEKDSDEIIKIKEYLLNVEVAGTMFSLADAMGVIAKDIRDLQKERPKRNTAEYNEYKAKEDKLKAQYEALKTWNAELAAINKTISASAKKQAGDAQKYFDKQKKEERQQRYQGKLKDLFNSPDTILKDYTIKSFSCGATRVSEGIDVNMDFVFDKKSITSSYIKNLLLTSGVNLETKIISELYEKSLEKDKKYTANQFIDDILALAKKSELGKTSILADKLFTLPINEKSMNKVIKFLQSGFNIGMNLDEMAEEMNSLQEQKGKKDKQDGENKKVVESVKPVYIVYSSGKGLVRELIVGMDEDNNIYTANASTQFDSKGILKQDHRKAKKLTDFKDAKIVYTSSDKDEADLNEQLKDDEDINKINTMIEQNKEDLNEAKKINERMAKILKDQADN